MAMKAERRISRRTRGTRHGYIIRLVSPSDLGEVLKPFVFLDLFDGEGPGAPGDGLHPHSGIATVTYIMQGSIRYVDTDGRRGVLPEQGLEWMKAGGGAWHGGGLGESKRTRGFQLWIALPPTLEQDPAESIYLPPSSIREEGPARVLLGSFGRTTGVLPPPSPLTYLYVRLASGERWRYQPPKGHTVAWAAIGGGHVVASEPLRAGDLAIYELSEGAIDFEARSDVEFVLGSAVPHPYPLALGTYSVHTSPKALEKAESKIAGIRTSLVAEGRL